MDTFTIMDLFLAASTIFIVVIWILLSLVLFRVYKILWTVVELVWYYNKFKQFLWFYSYIPTVVKEKVFSIFKSKENNSLQKK